MKKRIVVCADGTWNRPEKDDTDVATNVLRFARAIKPTARDGTPQQVFYDWGIGSYHDKVVAGATGSGLHKNIMDGYRYVVQNYAPGDDLYFFGFSRGAYTIRSLCGLINNVGIVKRPDARLIQKAFDHYKRPGKKHAPKGEASVAFRAAHSHPKMRIHFVGVWDTVGAMGIPVRFLGFLQGKDEFYDTKIGPNVKIARHALAIDEWRSDFEPTIWLPQPEHLDLQQVWFCGAHSDIGGGYDRDRDGTVLADIPLAWMVKEARRFDLAIETHLTSGITNNPHAKVHTSRRSFYRLKRAFYRPIVHGLSETLIHRSVKERWEADAKYRKRAKNLASYLEENGGSWGRLVS